MPETKEEEKIQLRSEEVQEILSYVPHWIIRAGITVIFVIVCMLLLSSWFIKYPEIIVSRASVVTQNPPVRLVAQATGRIQLLVKDNAYVKKDEYLVVIESPAMYLDVIEVKEQLLKAEMEELQSIDSVKLNFEKNYQLGDLQQSYSVLKQHYLEFRYFLQDNFYQDKIESIRNQYSYYRTLNEKLRSQSEILGSELDLVQKKFNSDKSLYKQGVIAEVEYNRSEGEYLQKKYSHKNTEISLVNNEIQLEEYKKTIIDLNQQYQEKKREYTIALQETLKKLKADIGAWEQRYIIKAPIEGAISYFKFYSDNQFINAGEEILTVIPKSGEIIAKVVVPSIGSGKIEPGQRVNIKLDNYPYKEFGTVEGKVESISHIGKDNTYLVNVRLPKGLKTSYGKPVEFKQEMSGVAEVITKDLRLIERIFNQLRSLIRNS